MKKRITSWLFVGGLLAFGLTGICAESDLARYRTDAEPEMDIENWMTADDYWSGTHFQITEEPVSELELESWMKDDDFWK